MPNLDLKRNYPKEAHLAAHEAAHNLHLTILKWTKQTVAPRSLLTLLERTSLRAAEALFFARRTRSYERHLDRARDDLWLCLARFTMLTDAGQFPRELFYDAQSRINQILVGIDQLHATPVDKWIELELPARISMGDARSAALEQQELDKKIAAAANIPRFFPQRLKAVVKKPDPKDKESPSKAPNGEAKGPAA